MRTATLTLLSALMLGAAGALHAQSVQAEPDAQAALAALPPSQVAGSAAPATASASDIGPLATERRKLLAAEKRVTSQLAKLEKSIALNLQKQANAAKRKKSEPSPALAEKLKSELARAYALHAELSQTSEAIDAVEARMQGLLEQLDGEYARLSRKSESAASAATRAKLAVIDIKRWLKKPLAGKEPSTQEDLVKAEAEAKAANGEANGAKRATTLVKTQITKAKGAFDLGSPENVANKRQRRVHQLEKAKGKLDVAQRKAEAAPAA